MAVRKKAFTVNRDLSYRGVNYKAGDEIDGAALAGLLDLRPDCVDGHKPNQSTEEEEET